jgi:predicted TIM-barrel fold metal-dependent hydrolase
VGAVRGPYHSPLTTHHSPLTMIDTHIHVVPPQLPGAASLGSLLECAPEQVVDALLCQMRAAGVEAVVAMGCVPQSPDDPLGVAGTLAVAAVVPALHAVGVADPRQTDADQMRRAAAVLEAGRVCALKIYLGYLHYPPDHAGYQRYYELAERFRLPVIFHTGDTYSHSARLRFALPLLIDDVAVDHRKVNFVLAHLGNPWLTDAAEVVYKNCNVWADLSGMVVGDETVFTAPDRQDALADARAGVARAFRYAERPNRFLYGSDWPLVPMAPYRNFIASAIPEVYHPQVFEENAGMLFKI